MNPRYFIIFFLLFTGCSNFRELSFIDRNPTEFTYDYSIDDVKLAINNRFDRYDFRKMGLYYGDNLYPDSLSIFIQRGNENDYCLSTYDDPIGKSYIYFRGSQALDYIASFHLHLQREDDVKTKVSVFTLKPRVVTGLELLPNIHGVRPFEYKEVEPSSIEEYEILLVIGKELGQKGMPSLKRPSSR